MSEEEIAQYLYQLLWQEHVSGEWVWLIVALAAPFLGLVFYLSIMRARDWWGHLRRIGEALYFFISPYAPRYMVLVGDLDGYHIDYGFRAYPGKEGWTVIVRGREYLVPGDPRKFARPTGIWGMKPPVGSGPFHAGVALVVGWLVAIALSVAAMTQTAWITMVAFQQPPTTVDVIVLLMLVGTVVWGMRSILSLEASTGLVVTLTRVPPGNLAVPSDPAPENVPAWARLLFEALGKKWNPVEEVEKVIGKLKEYMGEQLDKWSAASILAEARAAFTFREKLSYLEETLDRHVEILEAQALRGEEKQSRVHRWGPWIALAAVFIAGIALWLALGVSVSPVGNATNTSIVGVPHGNYTFPTPPPPPGYGHVTTPAQPPTPPVTRTGYGFPTPPSPPGGG
ncbi:MAG: hypothetical protein F7C37_06150 [Desulfurococcales archaeon]|nr:hypothetical protein [Desulfurococcales archaeon]